jgi:hypothetical protein
VKVLPTLCLLTLVGMLPSGLAAQGWQPRITGSAASVTTVTLDSSGRSVADGFSVGVDGALRRGPVSLLAGYAEGPVGPRAERMVFGDGWAGVQYQVAPAFAVRAGPVVRVLIADSLTLRWVHWRVAGRVTAPLSFRDLSVYGEGWAGTGARSALTTGASTAVGGVVGVEWRIDRGALRVEYTLDEARRSTADRLTIERLALILDLTWR